MLVAPPRYIRLIVFHKGKRVEKRLRLNRDSVATLKDKATQLRERGVKCRVVCLTTQRLFPHGDIKGEREAGKLWCPYCGDWSFFRVPKPYPKAQAPMFADGEVMSREFFLTVAWRQDLKVCAWCEISENDWYVCRANGTFGSHMGRRRRSSKRGRRSQLRKRR